MPIKSKISNYKNGLIALLGLSVTIAVAFSDINTSLYEANILSYPEHAPFDGTVYPVKKAPDWVHLDAVKKNAVYSDLADSDLLAIPFYDPSVLAVSTDTLKWGNEDHNKIRNAKITYSVPYMGDYRLSGLENAGSHLAVDIKIPIGTPVFSIANGTVIKASTQEDGFGHHIVVQHNNFPTLDDPNAKTKIYSSYSHLGDVLVSVGDVVTKGDQIALSGETGTATTPHLHFQIDNDQAPWHPFWPFTWKEASDAGLNFFSAINEGLGKENALATTFNPLKYVQAYMGNVSVESTPSSTLAADDTAGPEAVSYTEDELEVVVPVIEPVEEPIVAEELVVVEEPVVESSNSLFSDVSDDSEYYDAIKFLVDNGVISGYADGTFRPDKTVNRVEALKFILLGIKADLIKGELPFSDVSQAEWYSEYLYTGYEKSIVNGNPDGSFKPENPVNRAEFLKILFLGMKVDINPTVTEKPYYDVEMVDWYAPYISYAKKIEIVDTKAIDIYPSKPMTRAEVAEAMYKLMKLGE